MDEWSSELVLERWMNGPLNVVLEHLAGRATKASCSTAADLVSILAFPVGNFSDRVIPVT